MPDKIELKLDVSKPTLTEQPAQTGTNKQEQ
jgi:hypothetical protein